MLDEKDFDYTGVVLVHDMFGYKPNAIDSARRHAEQNWVREFIFTESFLKIILLLQVSLL